MARSMTARMFWMPCGLMPASPGSTGRSRCRSASFLMPAPAAASSSGIGSAPSTAASPKSAAAAASWFSRAPSQASRIAASGGAFRTPCGLPKETTASFSAKGVTARSSSSGISSPFFRKSAITTTSARSASRANRATGRAPWRVAAILDRSAPRRRSAPRKKRRSGS